MKWLYGLTALPGCGSGLVARGPAMAIFATGALAIIPLSANDRCAGQ
ncbi:hypothetical protein BH18ACI5_BH18ACI5_23610 [soil metagenome]